MRTSSTEQVRKYHFGQESGHCTDGSMPEGLCLNSRRQSGKCSLRCRNAEKKRKRAIHDNFRALVLLISLIDKICATERGVCQTTDVETAYCICI